MVGRKWVFLALLFAAAPAWGQDQETINKALRAYLDAYANCIKENAKRLSSTSESAEAVADRAFAACANERQALLKASQEEPVGYSAEQAATEMQQADTDLRPLVLETIKLARD
jgi:hypothetical protein